MNKPKLPKLKRRRRVKPKHAAPAHQGAHRASGTGHRGYGVGSHRRRTSGDYGPEYHGRHRADDPDRYIRPTPVYVGGRRVTPLDDRSDRHGHAYYRSTNR